MYIIITRSLIFMFVLITPLHCLAKDVYTINDKTVEKVMKHIFSIDVKIAKDRHPYYVAGDFNYDGIQDVAVLFFPQEKYKNSQQVQSCWPWAIADRMQSNTLHKSLAIINGHPDGWMSPKTKVFVFFDKLGTLETPSFQLIIKKRSEKDYHQLLSILPTSKTGDLIILPTEAGIDTYIYWNKSAYELHIPSEEP